MILIIPITKDEAMYLRNVKKVRCHISKPTRNGKRYMEENPYALRALDKYRNGRVVGGGKRV